MLRTKMNFDEGGKRPINLSLSVRMLEMARELGMNVSATADGLLAAEVKRQYWARWNDDNKDAVANYNARVAREGIPLASYRTFMKGK